MDKIASPPCDPGIASLVKERLVGYEIEIPIGAELHPIKKRKLCLADVECAKNPNHSNFIPIDEFGMNHLPSEYRHQLWYDYLNYLARRTGRVCSEVIGNGRPLAWPNSQEPYPASDARGLKMNTFGTGWVVSVYAFSSEETGEECPCKTCRKSQNPSKTWGKLLVETAAHVICDDEEALNSELELFFRSADRSEVNVISGLRVYKKDIERDWSEVIYVTHDKELYDKLRDLSKRYDELRYKVIHTYRHYTNEGDLAVIMSHPHGCSQQITIGRWTKAERVPPCDTRYHYTTSTCPGSSGAPVVVMGRYMIGWLKWANNPHCRARDGYNQSSVFLELR